MAIKIRNTREYIDPDKFRMIALIYGMPGSGKTTFLGTCPPDKTGIAACENGQGNGLLSIAERGFEFCLPESLSDVQEFCSGKVFPSKLVLGLDSLSALMRTIVKDACLAIPRANGESAKRKQGILELDDYQVLGELGRKLIDLLTKANPDKHIIVTALERYDKPGPNDPPGTEALIGPDLAGQLFLGAPAMFDFVFRMRTRTLLKDPKDAKSKFTQRYLITQPDAGMIAKCRSNALGKPLLDKEEIIDLETGQGTFSYLVDKITKGYNTAVNHEREVPTVLSAASR